MENYFGDLGTSQEEALKAVAEIIDGILKAQDDGDYEAFCSYFEPTLREKITAEAFSANQVQIQASMGKLLEKEFVTSLKRDGLIGLVYKTKFSETDDDFMVTITLNDKVSPVIATGIWIS